ncbi:MAG: hypothetical protein JWQ83_1674 [Lacunisphaera sp.]|nr:hypothetical protein [Lacunisphaera sp.]
MKYTRYAMLLLVLGATLLFSGCASMSSQTAPGANLAKIKKIYVVHLPPDERGINRVIADQLNLMGYQALTGEANAVPAGIDATLTYQDKWMWDITMYMIRLSVQLREPQSDIALATATSYRPSLQRKTPAGMAQEVLTQLFQAK